MEAVVGRVSALLRDPTFNPTGSLPHRSVLHATAGLVLSQQMRRGRPTRARRAGPGDERRPMRSRASHLL
ncbi:MAG TPA: hypothetical protein VHR35_02580 [Nocardioides sp.]|nr:hypothetical protein [Nocardioides sp.]